MSVVVAEGEVVVTADGTAIGPQIARDIDGNQARVGESGKNLGKNLVAGFLASAAVLKAADWLGGAIDGASDLAETVSKSTAIFGASQGTIDKWASGATTALGMSKSAAMEAASNFGDMFLQLGFAGDAATTMSTGVVQAAADLGSFKNLPTADVSDRISAAFRGEYDSLQALIPNISAARVESEAMTATGKKSADQLTAQEKATAVLAIINKDGARAMGDFARTSDGYANSQKIAAAQVEELQTKVGGALLPVMTTFTGFLISSVLPALSSMATFIGDNVSWIGPLAIGIGAVALAVGVWTGVQWLLNAAMTANPIGFIIVAVGLLVGALIWVATQTTFFQDTWTNAVAVFGTTVGMFSDFFGNTVGMFSDFFTNTGGMLAAWGANTIGMFVDFFTNTVGMFVDFFTNTVGMFVDFGTNVGRAVGLLGAVFSAWWSGTMAPVFGFFGTAFQAAKNTAATVFGFIGSAVDTIGGAFGRVFGGLGGVVSSAFGGIVGVIRGPINAVISLVNGAIGAVNGISVTIPSWVPVVGGQTFGVKLPKIPMLARGSNNAPGAFIAGENGPELITGAQGATVRPYSATKDILAGVNAGTTVHIGQVVIDAKNVKEFTDVVDMLKALPQVARTGRGTRKG